MPNIQERDRPVVEFIVRPIISFLKTIALMTLMPLVVLLIGVLRWVLLLRDIVIVTLILVSSFLTAIRHLTRYRELMFGWSYSEADNDFDEREFQQHYEGHERDGHRMSHELSVPQHGLQHYGEFQLKKSKESVTVLTSDIFFQWWCWALMFLVLPMTMLLLTWVYFKLNVLKVNFCGLPNRTPAQRAIELQLIGKHLWPISHTAWMLIYNHHAP